MSGTEILLFLSAGACYLGSIWGAFQLAGTPSLTASRLCLLLGWLSSIALIWVSEGQAQPKHSDEYIAAVAGIAALITGLFGLPVDRWITRKHHEQRQEGRKLSDWQHARLISALSQFKGSRLLILRADNEETKNYAKDFRAALKQAGWKVKGPRLAPETEMLMDVQVSTDNYLPKRQEAHVLIEALKQTGIKMTERCILSENVPRGLIVLWVGSDSPIGWSAERVPPPTVPAKYSTRRRLWYETPEYDLTEITENDKIREGPNDVQIQIIIALAQHPEGTDRKRFFQKLASLEPPIDEVMAIYNLQELKDKFGFVKFLPPSTGGRPQRYILTQEGRRHRIQLDRKA